MSRRGGQPPKTMTMAGADIGMATGKMINFSRVICAGAAALTVAPWCAAQMPAPAYPVYYERPYYSPIRLDIGLGFWGGHGGHHHWH